MRSEKRREGRKEEETNEEWKRKNKAKETVWAGMVTP
jgi:hypothetical protein